MSAPTLILRADAGPEMGIGHVMRCLALAQAWRDAGRAAHFFGNGFPPELRDRIKAEGMLLTEAGDMDPGQMAALCERPVAVVQDGYHFSSNTLSEWRATGLLTLVVDDNADRPQYDADLLLNHNPHALDLDYRDKTQAELLLGPEYLLLQKGFSTIRVDGQPRPDVDRVLVTMGGSDPGNHCRTVLRAIGATDFRPEVTVLAGPANPRFDALRGFAKECPFPTTVLKSAPDIPNLFARTDLAVTSAGVTSLELASLGIPMLALQTTPVQAGVADAFRRQEMALVPDPGDCDIPSKIADALTRLMTDAALRARLARNAREHVNRGGAALVASRIGQRTGTLVQPQPGMVTP